MADVNKYVTLSGPALATMTSNTTYLSLLKDTGEDLQGATVLCTIRRDKEKKTHTLCALDSSWDHDDLEALLNFLKAVVSHSGGQSVVANDATATLLTVTLKAWMTASDGSFIDPGLNLILVVQAQGNSARFTTEMIQQLPTSAFVQASAVSLTVSKKA